MFLVIAITTVVLIVETYAWFVGTSTVSTNEFTITVTGVEGLELSLDGSTWYSGSNKLTISQASITTGLSSSYSTNTNKWPTSGLVPLSSAGVLDTTNGRLILFEKSSLAASTGGYRLISTQFDNSSSEGDGYVAFDLFIKNGKGEFYSGSYGATSAESIYLTKDSSATFNGTDFGAANSVRIGFFIIGGVKTSGATVESIQNISCSMADTTTQKKVCPAYGADQKYYWNIWEPNYNVHTSNLVSYFNRVCKNRDTTTGDYTSDACSTISNTANKYTYAVYHEISSSDNVDIYDGQNGYTATTTNAYSSTSTALLKRMITYIITSSTNYSDTNQLLKLAGNSISKVRIYIWLEGQDIDNYDLITGSQFDINFGFTKDRYGIEESSD